MPPRKRKAPTKVATPVNKKVRIEDTATIEEPEDATPTRPKRKSVGTPQYKFTRANKRSEKQADDSVKAEETVVPDPAPLKRRGRPPKDSATATTPPTTTKAEPAATARAAVRGRPAKKPAPGKASKASPAAANVKDAPTGKKRGRPRGSTTASTTELKTTARSKKMSAPKTTKPAPKVTKPAAKGIRSPRKRGRPSKKVSTQFAASLMDPLSEDMTDADGFVDEEVDEEEDQDNDHQYWLMKAEPNDRFEKGVNVKFSIDDLDAAQAPEPWDGVRNYVARNNMRAMRKGDLAFFYHSNCSVPGIVGVMRIVQEHSTDKSAFDPNHPYYDPKSSPSNPKWDVVHVELVKKLEMQITLKMMQEVRNNGGELKNMQLLRLSRLSVSAVSPREWRYILGMANENVNIGENETEIVVRKDGYEADTDGEVDGGPKEELNGDLVSATVEPEDAKIDIDGTLEPGADVVGDLVDTNPA